MEILLFLYGREDFGGGYAEAFLQMMSIMKNKRTNIWNECSEKCCLHLYK
jgi:hypothetical protein